MFAFDANCSPACSAFSSKTFPPFSQDFRKYILTPLYLCVRWVCCLCSVGARANSFFFNYFLYFIFFCFISVFYFSYFVVGTCVRPSHSHSVLTCVLSVLSCVIDLWSVLGVWFVHDLYFGKWLVVGRFVGWLLIGWAIGWAISWAIGWLGE